MKAEKNAIAVKHPFLNHLYGPEKGLLFLVREGRKSLGFLFGLLGEQDSLDVRQDTTLSNGDTGQQLVQFLVVSDGKLKMSGDDSGLLVVSGCVTGQLENLSGQVLKYCGQVHGGPSAHTFGIISLSQKPVNTTDGELQSRPAGSSLALSLHFTTFSSTRHDRIIQVITSRMTERMKFFSPASLFKSSADSEPNQ